MTSCACALASSTEITMLQCVSAAFQGWHWDGVAQDGAETWVEMTLHDAAKSGDVAEVRRLVAIGVDLDGRDACGQTALQLAATRGHVEMMMVLVEHGVDKEAKDADGWTALH